MNKQLLCSAFCEELQVNEVPAGFAVSTPFVMSSGDAVGFYMTRDPSDASKWRLEDSGLLIPSLEASGVNIESGQRAEMFSRLLIEHGASYDQDSMELHSEYVSEQELPHEAMRFVSLIMRVQDLEMLEASIVEKTFQDDARKSMSEYFSGIADIAFRGDTADESDEFSADAIVSAPSGAKLAVYYGTRDARVDEAVIRALETRSATQRNEKVAVLIETVKPANVSARSLQRAMNRVDRMAVYSNDVSAAMAHLGDLISVRKEAVH